MNFKFENGKDFRPFPYYERPVQIGHFSTDSENKFYDDGHQMKYLSLPENLKNLHLDLNDGYSKYIGVYNDEEDPYNKLLRWIISHKKEVRNLIAKKDLSRGEIDFICHRCVLIAIASTPFEKSTGWLIHATKFRSVIYLCRIEKPQEDEDDKQRRMKSWGYKFEQYITSDSINSKPDTSHPVNVNEKYFVVMRSKLKNLGLLFSGETDAVDPQYLEDHPKDSKSMNRFLEIKTNSQKQNYYFRLKLLKWYLQSFIAGVPRLICGFRNGEGIVTEVKLYNVSELPEMAKGLWSPDACLNFGYSFLRHVKQCTVKDDPKVVYKFCWEPGSSVITCEELSPEYQFLPEWYIKEISAL